MWQHNNYEWKVCTTSDIVKMNNAKNNDDETKANPYRIDGKPEDSGHTNWECKFNWKVY